MGGAADEIAENRGSRRITLDGYRLFSLFDESNFEIRPKQQYPPVLEAGLAQHGLALDDVLAVSQDFGLWAICKQGIFHARLKGVFNKRAEVDRFIPYSEIVEARVESSGPRTGKIVLYDVDDKKIAEIDFSAGGPEKTLEGEQAQCRRVLEIIDGAWRAVGNS
jgi:hypothetical protein